MVEVLVYQYSVTISAAARHYYLGGIKLYI